MSDGFVPPQEVRSAAARGLELRKKHGRGGTAVGIARARDLSNGTAVSFDTIKRMNSFFARHEVDKKGKDWDNAERPSNGKIAWLLWGGDAGWAWAKRIIREQDKKEKSVAQDTMTSTYASIVKYDKNDDGTLLVYGKATDDTLDIDQQICDAAWLDRAMPEWFKSGGNIREQHSQIAAGVAREYEAKNDGHYITALVVDPVSAKKVETGVLKGFSIGIKAPRVIRDQKAANGRIIDGHIVEVSLVDRPANPNAKLMLAKSVDGELSRVEELVEKREVSTEEREQLSEEGKALPDGSYPIANVADLKNAIQSHGRAKNKAKVKQHIIRRARALDAVDQLPEDWNVEKSLDMAKDFLAKFDATAFEKARNAIAELIQVEAGEIVEGHDERASLYHLFEAITHLQAWFEGEEAEGEVTPEVEDTIERAAEKDEAKAEEEEAEEAEALEEEEEEEVEEGESEEEEADMEKSIETEPEETAEVVEEVSADTTAESVEEMVEKAVTAAISNIRAEVTNLMSAKEAAEEKAAGLELQVAELLTKAAGGGPKRTARTSAASLDDNLVKAATYRAKANAATDPVLAKGYRTLAEEFEAKSKSAAE